MFFKGEIQLVVIITGTVNITIDWISPFKNIYVSIANRNNVLYRLNGLTYQNSVRCSIRIFIDLDKIWGLNFELRSSVLNKRLYYYLKKKNRYFLFIPSRRQL